MPDKQKNISSDAIRSILQHTMFGVLAVLIILNWRVHEPMNYEPFEIAFGNSENVISAQSRLLHSSIIDIKDEERLDYQYSLEIQASKIISSTNELLKNLDSVNTALYNSKNFFLTDNEKLLGASVIALTKNYYINIIGFLEVDSNETYLKYFPLSREVLNNHEALLANNFLFFEYPTKEIIIAGLSSLRNDLINMQHVSLYNIFDRMQSGGCNFGRGYRPVYFLNDNFFSENEKFKMEIVVGRFGNFLKDSQL